MSDTLKTKEKIILYVTMQTEQFCIQEKLSCSAASVCEDLSISRSLASQYLNDLTNEEKLIKIISRPVFFLHKETIEAYFDISITQYQFEDIDEFHQMLKEARTDRNHFSRMIGAKTSLSHCIQQCKSAIQYAENGIPILLRGEKGCGKRYLGSLLYDYGKETGVFNDQSGFFIYDCTANINKTNQSYDLKRIFGYYSSSKSENEKEKSPHLNEGLLDRLKNGLLFIHHAELLSLSCQKMLCKYIQQGTFIPFGSDKERASKTHLIFSTSEKGSTIFESELFHYIPIVCQIPALDERFSDDKRELIYHFFRMESRKIKKKIMVNDHVLQTLMNFHFPDNIEQLQNTIKALCVNASMEAEGDVMNVYQYHLPDFVLIATRYEDALMEEPHMIDISKFQQDDTIYRIQKYFQNVLQIYDQYLDHSLAIDDFFEACIHEMNTYYDYLVFEKRYANSRISSMEQVLVSIIDEFIHKYDLLLSASFSFILARIITTLTTVTTILDTWEMRNQKIQRLLDLCEQYYEKEYQIARELRHMIMKTLDIAIDDMNLFFIILNINFFNRGNHYRSITGIIISHGYSTASSVADACNRMLGSHIFEAFDMPVNTSFEQILFRLKNFLNSTYTGKNIILLVDMGSLEQIGEQLAELFNSNIGVIDNISTKIALETGEKIQAGENLKDILQYMNNKTAITTQFYGHRKKEEAVLFTSETGTASTQRVMQLFINSLPHKLNIHILNIDFAELERNREQTHIFEIYDVIFILGSIDLNIRDIPFISLEDIVTFENVQILNHLLGAYLNEKEIEIFNKNLLKNFSLENIMNFLTILNPVKLLDFVEEGVADLQKALEVTFDYKIIVGLYIHISCLIERLVTKQKTEIYDDLDTFQRHHQVFIDLFQECFRELANHYNVQIPEIEIAYIYRYIYSNMEGKGDTE